MATMGRTARSMDRRDRAAALPEGDTALLQRPSPTAFEARIHSPAAWLDRPGLARPLAVPPPAGFSARLSEAVAAAVIPRLQLAHAAAAESVPNAADVTALSALLLRHDAAGASAYLEALHHAGTSAEHLFLDLLAPAARLLGQFWADDVCDFATVTLGMMQLRRMQRDFAPRFLAGSRPRPAAEAPRALIVSVPGEQHVFGLDLVADFFRRAGWQADVSPLRSADELASMVRRESYAVVGLSLGDTDRMDALAATIRKLRRASRNRSVGVMVGGPAFIGHPGYVALVGADATAADARQAPLQAERLLRVLAQHD